MKLRGFATVLAVIGLFLSPACKEKAGSQAKIPKGFGAMVIIVQDESGKPVPGATVQIVNRSGQVAEVRSDSEGRTKGAGEISQGPFSFRIVAPGYVPQELSGITLVEGQTVPLSVKLRKS